MSGKNNTEKLHVLAVLEDGSSKDAYGIRSRLEKDFDLRPRLNALRKNLQRCFKQEIVKRIRIEGSYHYGITKKGKERLRRIRVKRQEEFAPTHRIVLHSLPEKFKQKKLLYRVIEVASAIRLCDIALSLSPDNATLNFARSTKIYWKLEFSELVPYITEQIMKTIERISWELAKTIERMLTRVQ